MLGFGGGRAKGAASGSRHLGVTGPSPAPPVDLEPDRFNYCLPFTLKEEGGFVDDPRDPGGATYMGITLAVFEDFIGVPATAADLRNASPDLIAQIYKTRYWNAAFCPQLPAGVDLSVFDMAVNAGARQSIRCLQGALGVARDGIVGSITLHELDLVSPRHVCERLYGSQTKFYRSLANFKVFGEGWLNRSYARLNAALAALPSAHAERRPR